jgi:hypothetical protein
MKATLSSYDFINEFRQIRPDNFSYEALEMLFDYLEEIDPEMEFDPIAICCDFQESHYSDIIGDYETDICEALGDDCDDEDAKIEYIRNWLNDNTSVVGEPLEGVFVFLSF